MKALEKALEGKTFRHFNINLLIHLVGFIVMLVILGIFDPYGIVPMLLGGFLGMTFGINLIGWLVRTDEWLEEQAKKEQLVESEESD